MYASNADIFLGLVKDAMTSAAAVEEFTSGPITGAAVVVAVPIPDAPTLPIPPPRLVFAGIDGIEERESF